MKNIITSIIAKVVSMFAELNGTKFIGIREYVAKTSGEIANHVVNANFSYSNAIAKDLLKLQNGTIKDFEAIAKKANVTIDLVGEAVSALINSFENNSNPATQSNQSKAQHDLYIPITNAIKLNKETLKLHIYALAVSKEVLKAGEYKTVKSRPLTIAKNEAKKYFNLTTNKYRNFIIDPEMVSGLAINGDVIKLA